MHLSSIIGKKRVVQIKGLTLKKIDVVHHTLVLIEHSFRVFYYTAVSVACKTLIIGYFKIALYGSFGENFFSVHDFADVLTALAYFAIIGVVHFFKFFGMTASFEELEC